MRNIERKTSGELYKHKLSDDIIETWVMAFEFSPCENKIYLAWIGKNQIWWINAHFECLFNFFFGCNIEPSALMCHKIQNSLIRVTLDSVEGLHTGQVTRPLVQLGINCAEINQVEGNITITLTRGQWTTQLFQLGFGQLKIEFYDLVCLSKQLIWNLLQINNR